jgi:predicted DNA-binding transcriptional regulator AlpA
MTRLLLNAHESADLLGMSLRRFRDVCKEPTFPAGRELGPRSTRWLRSELEAYAASLPAVQRDEPRQLAAARAARAAGEPTAHAPFPAPSWREIKA